MDSEACTDWSEWRKQEEARERQFRAALDALLDASGPLWHIGDGFGGEVFNSIINAAHKRGFPAPYYFVEMPSRVSKLAERDGWECHYCGAPLGWGHPLVTAPQVEHRIPRSRGGSNRLGNLVLACQPCNSAKGTMTDEEFMGAPS